jgi:hypothetical protein
VFQFNHHHQGVYYLSFAKVIVIKISVKIHHCGWFGGVKKNLNTIFEHERLSGLIRSGDTTQDFTNIYTQ